MQTVFEIIKHKMRFGLKNAFGWLKKIISLPQYSSYIKIL